MRTLPSEFLHEMTETLGPLLYRAEMLEGDNPEGTYPSEILMTLRIAYITALRARDRLAAESDASPTP
jgi:hypothetical protein